MMLVAAVLVSFVLAAPAQAQEVTGHPAAAELNWSTYNWWAYYQGRTGCHPSRMRIYLNDRSYSDWRCQIWLQRTVWTAATSGPWDGCWCYPR